MQRFPLLLYFHLVNHTLKGFLGLLFCSWEVSFVGSQECNNVTPILKSFRMKTVRWLSDIRLDDWLHAQTFLIACWCRSYSFDNTSSAFASKWVDVGEESFLVHFPWILVQIVLHSSHLFDFFEDLLILFQNRLKLRKGFNFPYHGENKGFPGLSKKLSTLLKTYDRFKQQDYIASK